MTNSTVTNEAFDKVLKDVRNSYRLLHQYQRRLMDLVVFIGNQWEFQFEFGESNFCSPRKKWKDINPQEHWAWDFLLLYNYTFAFRPRDFGDWKEVRLMLNIVSDTGFYDTEHTDKTNLEQFKSAAESKTQLHIILKTKGIDWKSYRESQYPSIQHIPEPLSEKGKLILGKKYDLSEFIDEESTRAV